MPLPSTFALMPKRKQPQSGTESKKAKIIAFEDSMPQLDYYSGGTGAILAPKVKKAHTDEFLKGLQFVLSKDPSLAIYAQEPFGVGLKGKTNPSLAFYFQRLVSGLISQQISGKAADAIQKKVVDNVGTAGLFPTPAQFHAKTETELRECGLSMKKAEYVRRLSRAFNADIDLKDVEEGIKFDLDYFDAVDDLQLQIDLQKFKGIGPWSSSMFTMFALERMDVFEPGDLGIRRGFTKYLKERPDLDKEVRSLLADGTIVREKGRKKISAKDKYIADVDLMDAVAHQFRPYRSIFMYLLWRLSDTTVSALAAR